MTFSFPCSAMRENALRTDLHLTQVTAVMPIQIGLVRSQQYRVIRSQGVDETSVHTVLRELRISRTVSCVLCGSYVVRSKWSKFAPPYTRYRPFAFDKFVDLVQKVASLCLIVSIFPPWAHSSSATFIVEVDYSFLRHFAQWFLPSCLCCLVRWNLNQHQNFTVVLK